MLIRGEIYPIKLYWIVPLKAQRQKKKMWIFYLQLLELFKWKVFRFSLKNIYGLKFSCLVQIFFKVVKSKWCFYYCTSLFSSNNSIWSSNSTCSPYKRPQIANNTERNKTLLVSFWKIKSKLTKNPTLQWERKSVSCWIYSSYSYSCQGLVIQTRSPINILSILCNKSERHELLC